MRECWLQSNRQALACGLIVPATLAVTGLALALGLPTSGSFLVIRGFSWALMVVATILAVLLVYFVRLPRLAYEDGCLLAYLRSSGPIRIPIEIVECFFLGQATTAFASRGGQRETATVVVRLAESAKEWHHRDVKPALGRWCDGYITIFGTWCEPLNGQLLGRMNDRLVEVQRDFRRTSEVNRL